MRQGYDSEGIVTTILVNTYTAPGASSVDAVVPFQTRPHLGIVMIGTAGAPSPSGGIYPNGWASPASQGSTTINSYVFARAFDDPTSLADPARTLTVSTTSDGLAVVALSISRDGGDIYNVGYHDVTIGSVFLGSLFPASGSVIETFGDSSDIAILGLSLLGVDQNFVNGTLVLTPGAGLTEIVQNSYLEYCLEVCQVDDLPADGVAESVSIDVTHSGGGIPRLTGFIASMFISSTFVRAGGGWHIGKAARGAW